MFEIIPRNTNFDFVGKRYIFMGISVLAMITAFVLLATRGLNYGIDFTGGAEVQVKFSRSVAIGDVRSALEGGGFKNVLVQQLGEPELNEFLAKFRGDEAELQKISVRAEEALSGKVDRKDFEIQRVDVVGPQAGGELRKSGFLSMFYALLCILVYVAIRFDMRYGPGAVIALFHDSVITMGIFVLTQKEFSLQIVAAILTIIGYSNNDTIIVFDRVRETLKTFPGRSIEETVNRSINETLSRTILTSVSTMMVVVSLMIFGGGVIHDFAFTMAIGIVVGTYSSIFIAAPVLIEFTRFQERRASRQKSGTSKPLVGTLSPK